MSLNPAISRIQTLVEHFVQGQSFWEFHNAFMDFYDSFEAEAVLTEAQLARYHELYEQIYMGAPDPVDRLSQADGIVGEAALRRRLAGFSLNS